ncbi:hypothetical protein LX64_01603 [Chitinophaga skermanii]|uniref:Collagen triple helix repeat protein n=1 Tax=Chitinophaga skermanii TaxID=331697 RepID=A0A327QPB5_9BACT|nr:hypothetical protein [Chitinophaga skermanii]RAJ06476.1 hypothetical protein LX64_01603 [Chitinophaga skermanii]
MKRQTPISQLVLVVGLLFAVCMISCSKDGSDGVDGATGPAGPAGPAGPQEPKGDPGSGNIIYSTWLDVAFKADTSHTAGGGIDTVGYYATIDAPKLTAALLSTADVKVYINANTAASPTIYPLPYYNAYSGLSIEMSASTQKIDLYSNGNMSTIVGNGVKYQQYRYMIIPGSVTARSAAPAVDWTNYAAVQAYLGLHD